MRKKEDFLLILTWGLNIRNRKTFKKLSKLSLPISGFHDSVIFILHLNLHRIFFVLIARLNPDWFFIWRCELRIFALQKKWKFRWKFIIWCCPSILFYVFYDFSVVLNCRGWYVIYCDASSALFHTLIAPCSCVCCLVTSKVAFDVQPLRAL